jgi:hypothetical protein
METKDFADFLAVLNSEGTVYVVIGGMALTANGRAGLAREVPAMGKRQDAEGAGVRLRRICLLDRADRDSDSVAERMGKINEEVGGDGFLIT